MSLVTVFAAGSTAGSCNLNYYADLGNGEYTCTNLTSDIITSAKEGQTPVIKVMKDFHISNQVSLTKDMVYDLNDHTVTMDAAGYFEITDANVTFKNGTIKIGTGRTYNTFRVSSTTKASSLTLDVKVETESIGAAVKVINATKETVVNVNGTWNIDGEIVDCSNGPAEKLTVNLNATVTGTRALVTLDAGASVVNVNGGSYTADKNVFEVTNGTLNVKAGTIKSKEGNAVKVITPTGSYKNVLKITGGNLVSEETYSVEFATTAATPTGKYSITDGTFTSGIDEDDNRLPALHTTAWNFLENHPSMISGGKFTGSIIGDVKIADKVNKTAAAAAKILVGNATVSEKDGVVTVGGIYKSKKH